MGEILPNGEIGGYEGYCQKCHKVIKTNMQGDEIGCHVCNSQNKQSMKLQKQDVVYIPFKTSKHIVLSGNETVSGVAPMKDMYLLTEYQLETLKQEYYAIGLKEAELKLNK